MKWQKLFIRGGCNSVSESIEEKQQRQNYALDFSWEKTAQKTLNFWDNGEIVPLPGDKKASIAILTPWPEQETGIANYEYKLVPYLQKYYEIDVYTNVE